MNEGSVREIWTRFQAGGPLSPEEDALLAEALRTPSSLREELLRDAEIDGILRNRRRTAEQEGAFLERLVLGLQAERDASGFVRRVESALPRVRPTSRGRTRRRRQDGPLFPALGWIVAVAAGALIAVVVARSPGPAPVAGPAQVERPVPKAEPSVPPVPPGDEGRERLVELDRRRRKAEAERKAAEDARQQERLDRAEAELRAVAEAYRKAQEALANRPAEKEATPRTSPADPPRPEPPVTLASAAVVERVQGEAWTAAGPDDRAVVRAGDALPAGRAVETASGATLVLKLTDGTVLEIGPATRLGRLPAGDVTEIPVDRGEVTARVKPRQKGKPLVFPTPHAEAVVLGTTLRIAVVPDSTRLEVTEGRVRFKRRSDGRSLEVVAGHFAVAGAAVPFRAQKLPVEDVVVTVRDAALSGTDFQVVRDTAALGGLAVEAVRTSGQAPPNPAAASKVVFRFQADPDVDYAVWVRGRTVGGDSGSDSVILEFPGAAVSVPASPEQRRAGGGPRAFINGFCHRRGYWWVGGDADGEENGTSQDAVPATVRFSGAGARTAVLYVYESPVRVDAIWLSTRRRSRPDDSSTGPLRK